MPADTSDTATKDAGEAGTGDADTAATDANEDSSADKQIDLEREKERIFKENKRKMDEFEEKKKKAQKKVAELNARFGDWYFVISDDVYKKIHLSRSDVITEKESAKKDGTGVDSFRDLEGGIESKDDGHDHDAEN